MIANLAALVSQVRALRKRLVPALHAREQADALAALVKAHEAKTPAQIDAAARWLLSVIVRLRAAVGEK